MARASTERTYDLNTTTVRGPATTKELKAAAIKKSGKNTFLLTLPVSKVQVEFRLLTAHDENVLIAMAERRRKRRLSFQPVSQVNLPR